MMVSAVQYLFEAYVYDVGAGSPRLVHREHEDCHLDEVGRRASRILWSLPLAEVQEIVIVRQADTGDEVFRKGTGTSRHAWPRKARAALS